MFINWFLWEMMSTLCEINVHKCNIDVYFHQADSKLREEEKRALRYLETRRDCNSVQAVSVKHTRLIMLTSLQLSL